MEGHNLKGVGFVSRTVHGRVLDSTDGLQISAQNNSKATGNKNVHATSLEYLHIPKEGTRKYAEQSTGVLSSAMKLIHTS